RFTVALGSPDAHGKHGAGFRGHGARSVDCLPGGSCLAVACSGESFHRFGHSFGLVCASLYRLACRSLCHHFRRCSGVADRLSRSTPKPEARPRHWRGKRWPPSLPQRARRSGAFPGPAAARQRRRVPEEFAEAQRCRHWLSSPWLDDRGVRPRYFETMGIRLLRGRVFTDQDRHGGQPVAIIDENLAREYWPHQDALGQRIRNGNNAPWKTIVGIVRPVRHSQVVGEEASREGVEGSGRGVYSFPLYQENSPATFLIARTSGDAASLAGAI